MTLQEAIKQFARFDENGCLIWHGTVTTQGYPVFYTDYQQISVHREVLNEKHPLNVGEIAHHKCRVKRCILLDHLEPKTNAQHTADHKHRKGKFAKLCASGHSMSGANLYIVPSTGWHQCRTCKAISDRIHKDNERGTRPKGLHAHCHKGHELTADNLYIMDGVRRCKTCVKERRRKKCQPLDN